MNNTDNKTVIADLENLFAIAEKCRNAYFWSPDKTAGGRRHMEKKYSVPEIVWSEGGHEYTAEFVTQCSCSYVYTFGRYYKDGKKTTLTAIKNSYKRLTTSAEK